VRLLIGFLLVVIGAVSGAGYHWLNRPLDMPSDGVDLAIETGASAKEVVSFVVQAGVRVQPELLYAWFRLSGQAKRIRAGSYELDPTTTPRSLLTKLVQGDEALRSVTLVEGWNFRQVMAALEKADALKFESGSLSAPELMSRLGRPGVAPEGRFFPDTYTYAKGSSDIAVLQRAMRAMDKRLATVWEGRQLGSALQSPDEVLILASIIEKETGIASDRPMVSSVFHNRLRIGMRLQTDPTVIYGLGETFDGNLRKRDLVTDTPWNTYTRAGLPPTPIAMPGKASLLAAVQPATSKALYFVAKGNGASHFSTTLDEHNRAVNQYQRGQ
jgi:UPF0755 protein